jgi:hypothetical protein
VALSSRDRTRYARQLLLPQIGEAGQQRLLAAALQARPGDDAGAVEVAQRYLERAGVRVTGAGAEESTAIARGTADAAPLRVASSAEVDAIAHTPELREAARALAGALAAVGAIQHLVGLVGEPPALQIVAISSEEA